MPRFNWNNLEHASNVLAKLKKYLKTSHFNSTSNNDTINQCCGEVCLIRLMIPYSMVGPFGVGCGKRYQLIQSYQK